MKSIHNAARGPAGLRARRSHSEADAARGVAISEHLNCALLIAQGAQYDHVRYLIEIALLSLAELADRSTQLEPIPTAI